jgi:hypothetical protein
LSRPDRGSPSGIRAFDEAEADRDGRLVVRCEDVPEALADLSTPECLRAVLRHLRDGAGIRGVVLVHDRERAYGPRAMAVLHELLAIGRLLDQLAQRAPSPDFPGFTAKEMATLCARCAFRPASLFLRLRDRLLGDPAAFQAALSEVAGSLARYEEAGCTSCATATIQDLRILITELGKIVRA